MALDAQDWQKTVILNGGRLSLLSFESGTAARAATLAVNTFDNTLAGGATQVLASSGLGHAVYAVYLNWRVVTFALAEITLENQDGSLIIERLRTDVALAGTSFFGGVFVAQGVSGQIRLHNTSGIVSGTLACSLAYIIV